MSSSQTPYWRSDIHADRRPALLTRGRIKTALRRWFEARDFTEVEAAIRDVRAEAWHQGWVASEAYTGRSACPVNPYEDRG